MSAPRRSARCASAASTPVCTACAGTRFSIPLEDRTTVLDALFYVLREQDRTIAFRCACRAAMCGSCAMVINGHERLACKTGLASLKGPIRVEPLRNLPGHQRPGGRHDRFFEKYQAIEPRPMLDARRLAEPAVISDTDARRADRRGSGLHQLRCLLTPRAHGGRRPRLLGPAKLLRAFNVLSDEREAGRAADARRSGIRPPRCVALPRHQRMHPRLPERPRSVARDPPPQTPRAPWLDCLSDITRRAFQLHICTGRVAAASAPS